MKRALVLVLLLILAFETPGAPASGLAFSPDGSVLASTGYKCVEIRSPKDAAVIDRLSCGFSRVSSVAFHPSDPIIAAGGGTPGVNGAATLLDWKRKTVLRSFTNFNDLVSSVAINRTGTLLGIASADHTAAICPLLDTNAAPVLLIGHFAAVLAIAFSPDGETVVTGGADRSIKVWSAADGTLLRSFSQHTEGVFALAFRPANSTGVAECASASDDQTVRIWQPVIGRMVRIIRGHDEPVFALTYSPDGQALFSAGKSGVIRRLDTASDRILDQWEAHPEAIYSIAVSPDGRSLATGDWSGSVKVRPISLTP